MVESVFPRIDQDASESWEFFLRRVQYVVVFFFSTRFSTSKFNAVYSKNYWFLALPEKLRRHSL